MQVESNERAPRPVSDIHSTSDASRVHHRRVYHIEQPGGTITSASTKTSTSPSAWRAPVFRARATPCTGS